MMTLTEALNFYLLEDRAETTSRNYKRLLGDLFEWLGSERDIGEIQYIDLLKYTALLREKVSAESAFSYILIIKCFFNWAVKAQLIMSSPAAALKNNKPPKDLSIDRAMPLEIFREMLLMSYGNERDYAVIAFMGATGCRVSSIVSLSLKNLNLDEKTAYLWQKKNRYYTVYFDDETAEALKRWIAIRPHVPHDYIFTASEGLIRKRLTVAGITEIVRRWSAKAGGLRGKEYGPHSIRHLVGHTYANAGVPISAVASKLGHSDPKITLSHYSPRDGSAVREATDRVSLTKSKAPPPPPAAPPAVQEQSPEPEPKNITHVDWRSAG